MNKILVTGIGGNVGYGILRNIRRSYDSIFLIGTNTEKVSAGNCLCDAVYETPFATKNEYVPFIKKICNAHNVELIIPSTDYESHILSEASGELPLVAASPAITTKIFLDKYLSYQKLNEAGLAFAESILPSDYDGRFREYILKPREGRGSRNIFINPPAPESFSDEYIVQPLYKGKEITTAFYVTKSNELFGLITLERSLAAGATNICEVNFDFDQDIESYISKLILSLDIKGSCNLQCMVTEEGIMPFEVNCRISGTNSIRSQFGFKDVCYTIDEYLFGKYLREKPVITKGSAVRILHDIIYPGIGLAEIDNNSDQFYIYE